MLLFVQLNRSTLYDKKRHQDAMSLFCHCEADCVYSAADVRALFIQPRVLFFLAVLAIVHLLRSMIDFELSYCVPIMELYALFFNHSLDTTDTRTTAFFLQNFETN